MSDAPSKTNQPALGTRRHPFAVGDVVVYAGQRCNTTFLTLEPHPLRVGAEYRVEVIGFSPDITGDLLPVVCLQGVAQVKAETGKLTRCFAAANFDKATGTSSLSEGTHDGASQQNPAHHQGGGDHGR